MATGDKLANLKDLKIAYDGVMTYIAGHDAVTISGLDDYMASEAYGNLATGKKWNHCDSSDGYRHVAVPLPYRGGTLTIKRNTDGRETWIGVVQDYKGAPANNDPVLYSAKTTQKNWTNRVSISSTTDVTYDLPDDAHFIIVMTAQSGVACLPGTFTVSIPAQTGDVSGAISTMNGSISTLEGKMTTAEGAIETLSGKMTTAEGNISTLQTAMTSAQGGIAALNGDMAAMDARVAGAEQGSAKCYDRANLTGLTPYNGGFDDNGDFVNIGSENYQYLAVPCAGGMELNISPASEDTVRIAVVKSFTPPAANGDDVDYSAYPGFTGNIQKSASYSVILPLDARYILVRTKAGGASHLPAVFTLESQPRVQWLALGDSITEGTYSYTYDDNGVTKAGMRTDKTKCWVNRCALIKGFDPDNRGIGGSGWVKRGTQGAPKPNIRELITGTISDAYLEKKIGAATWAEMTAEEKEAAHDNYEELAQNWENAQWWAGLTEDQTAAAKAAYTALGVNPVPDFTKYDVLTVMLGVNDWKGGQRFGDFDEGTSPATESVYGNMRYFIEKALADNPALKIIMITPVNCRQGDGSTSPTASGNWGIGYAFADSDGVDVTLEDYYDAIKKVAEYYDIQFVDMLHSGIVNRQNAETMLPDKVHPSMTAHRQMAFEIAGRMNYQG